MLRCCSEKVWCTSKGWLEGVVRRFGRRSTNWREPIETHLDLDITPKQSSRIDNKFSRGILRKEQVLNTPVSFHSLAGGGGATIDITFLSLEQTVSSPAPICMPSVSNFR
jgi:hypothetical protein